MASRRPQLLLLLLLAALLAAALLWQRGWFAPRPVPVAIGPTPMPRPKFQGAWRTEQEFIVDRISQEVAELAAVATGKKPAPDSLPARPGHFRDHVFSPQAYAPIARQCLAGAVPSRGPGDERDDARLISALLEPRTAVLLREDAALSKRMAARPLEVGPHERAALLLGAFALRDAAGRSTDVRPALVRMTAHLALASALRGDQGRGLAGRLAEAVLVTLLGRETDAVSRLDLLEPGASTAVRAWLRALRLRNTGDWRIARDARGLTLLERLEEFRALVKGQGDAGAVAWLDRGHAKPLVDWAVIAIGAAGLTVDTANRFCDEAPMLQLAEAAEAWKALRATRALDQRSWVDALNEYPGRQADQGPRRVLAWDLWADRTQRHLVFELQQAEYYHSSLLAQPGEGRAFAERSRASFGRLELYPLVLRGHATDAEEYRAAMAALRELAIRSPERLTGGHWQVLHMKEAFAPVPDDLPDETSWFEPALPAGTLLDAARRIEVLPALQRLTSEELEHIRAQAPHSLEWALLAARRLPPTHTAADLAGIFGPLGEFNVDAMGQLADASWYDPPSFRRRQGALCDIVPERCLTLGYRLAELGFADEAAAAYQRGFDLANDRVTAANMSRWLVEYYLDHGQETRAAAVARRAAGTGSCDGLFVQARLHERTGRLPEAEEWYRRMLDHYRQPDQLVGFYYRQTRAGRAEFQSRLRDALAVALPAGLEPFDRRALSAPPADGVVIRKANDNTKRCGIRWGDVVVGLDGYRVRDIRGYDVVNALSLSPRMQLVVWHSGRYADVTTELWDRSFRVDMENVRK